MAGAGACPLARVCRHHNSLGDMMPPRPLCLIFVCVLRESFSCIFVVLFSAKRHTPAPAFRYVFSLLFKFSR